MATNYVHVAPIVSFASAKLPSPVPNKINNSIIKPMFVSQSSFRLPSPPSSGNSESTGNTGFYWK